MSDETLKSGPLFEPRFVRDWKPRSGQCRARSGGGSYHARQCTNNAKVKRMVETRTGNMEEVEYCGIHDPVRVKEKQEARYAAWKAKVAARDEAREQVVRSRAFAEACVAAVKAIAGGHNDPRGLAMKTLAEFQEDRPDE